MPEDVARARARGRRADGGDRADATALRADALPDPLGQRYLLEFDTDELAAARAATCSSSAAGIAGLTAALARRRGSARVHARHEGAASPRPTPGTRRAASPARWARPTRSSCTSPTRSWWGRACATPTSCARSSARRPRRSRELQALGVRVRPRGRRGAVALAREGGHSLPRVLHSGDATGAEVQDTLSARRPADARASSSFEDALPRRPAHRGRPLRRRARARQRRRASSRRSGPTRSCLPPAAAGQVYRVTTNPLDRDRRRRRGGVARGRGDRRHGVRAVPPHRARQRVEPEVPHHRGAARRGRVPARLRRASASCSACIRSPSSRRATS